MIRYQMVLAGAGWTHFARAWVAADIATGRLVELHTGKKVPTPTFALRAFYRVAEPLGPAGRWLVERLADASSAAPPMLPTPTPRAARGGSSERNSRRRRES
jgi:DNA-binding transcriptional LysR family regulator